MTTAAVCYQLCLLLKVVKIILKSYTIWATNVYCVYL